MSGKGRPKQTGRCQTREELEGLAWDLYYHTDMHQAAIARFCRVSDTVMGNILNGPVPAGVEPRALDQ